VGRGAESGGRDPAAPACAQGAGAIVLVLLAASLGAEGGHAGAVRVSVGPPEVVMDYSRDSCAAAAGLDLPDVQARALANSQEGTLWLVSGNAPANYWMAGPGFDSLVRVCTPVLTSGDSPYPHTFDNQEWITSVYRLGETVHALVHNEYHDPFAPACRPGVTDPSNPCWYNAITYAVSHDGGRSFTQQQAPGHVVAAAPWPWTTSGWPRGRPPGPYGYFSPSNIVRHRDGFYYALFFAIPDPANPARRGTCLMRTDDLADPASWRAFDGTGFALTMRPPYAPDGTPAPTGLEPCTFVSPGTIGDLHGSLTYNTYLEAYLLVGSGIVSTGGAPVCGTFFSLSDDLLHWSAPQLLLPGKLPYPPCTTDGDPAGSLIYPSIIDHAASPPNYETSGRTPHLYIVRWNQGLDRDLLRLPVTFERLGAPPRRKVPRAN